MNTKSDVINNLSQKFGNLEIVSSAPTLKKNKEHNIDSLIFSMNKMCHVSSKSRTSLTSLGFMKNKMKIGKKKLVKNNVINKIYTKYELFSLLNKKLFMDEIFGPILVRYFTGSIRILKIIQEENKYDNNYDADNSCISEIDE